MQIPARWSTAREPDPNNPSEAIFKIGRYINISPSRDLNDVKEGVIDLGVSTLVKEKDKVYFCAFNDENYLAPRQGENIFLYNRHLLPRGYYDVEIRVTFGESVKSKFLKLRITDRLAELEFS